MWPGRSGRQHGGLAAPQHRPRHAYVLGVNGHGVDAGVVLRNALVQVGDLAEQVADDGVGVARQVLQALAGTASGALVVISELGDQEGIAFDLVDHAVLVGDPARPKS